MTRGLKIVVCGLIPILVVYLVYGVWNVRNPSSSLIIGLAFFATGMMFLVGTAQIVLDKGFSLALGVILGLIAPLGTMIALILENQQKSPGSSGLNLKYGNIDLSVPIEVQYGDESPGKILALFKSLAAPLGGIYGMIHGSLYAYDMLSYKGGIPAAKVIAGVMDGLLCGLSVWGGIILLSIVFAPSNWLLHSSSGRKWMKRSGVNSTENTLPLRILAAVLAFVAIAWLVLSVIVLTELMTSKPYVS